MPGSKPALAACISTRIHTRGHSRRSRAPSSLHQKARSKRRVCAPAQTRANVTREQGWVASLPALSLVWSPSLLSAGLFCPAAPPLSPSSRWWSAWRLSSSFGSSTPTALQRNSRPRPAFCVEGERRAKRRAFRVTKGQCRRISAMETNIDYPSNKPSVQWACVQPCGSELTSYFCATGHIVCALSVLGVCAARLLIVASTTFSNSLFRGTLYPKLLLSVEVQR